MGPTASVREQSNWEHSAKFMTVCAHRINPGNCVRFLMLVKSTENDSLMIDMRRSCRCGYDSTDRESQSQKQTHNVGSVWALKRVAGLMTRANVSNECQLSA